MNTNYREALYQDYFADHGADLNSLVQGIESRKYFNNYHLKRFLPNKDPDMRILDLGCGYGAVLSSCQDLGYYNLTGVDSSPQAIKIAQQLTGLEEQIIKADLVCFLQDAIVKGFQWDIVLAIDVFEHFNKDEFVDILQSLKQVISPSGKLIVKIPNAQAPMAGVTTLGDFTHEMLLTPKSLNQVLRACGFYPLAVYESAPVPYKFTSTVRFLLWKLIRVWYTLTYAIETGALDNSMIWTNSFFAVATVK